MRPINPAALTVLTARVGLSARDDSAAIFPRAELPPVVKVPHVETRPFDDGYAIDFVSGKAAGCPRAALPATEALEVWALREARPAAFREMAARMGLRLPGRISSKLERCKMRFSLSLHIPIVFAVLITASPVVPAQTVQAVSVGEAEVQRCDEKIAMIQREILNRYDSALSEVQVTFQKAADLEGALAVRAERQRATKEGTLSEKSLVNEPKALRAIQLQMLAKQQELITQLVQETIPRLIEQKKALTVGGKLDEAVAVRGAIERLQNEHLPLVKPDPAVATPADILLQAYAADRGRADKIYKGNPVAVRGVVGGFRRDPADAKNYQLYLGGSAGGWVQCTLQGGDFRFQEEKQFNGTSLLVVPKGNEAGVVRVQKGQTLDLRGTCEGWEEMVLLSRCELVR